MLNLGNLKFLEGIPAQFKFHKKLTKFIYIG